MIQFLRALSFLFGCILAAAPPLLLLLFSYQIGEPPTDVNQAMYLIKPFILGLVSGGGLLLVGLPNLVVGEKRPAIRWLAGLLLFISIAVLFFIGFSGTVTQKISPVILAVQFIMFYVFVWPATSFSKFVNTSDVKNG